MIFVDELGIQRTCATKSTVFLPIMMGEAKEAVSKVEIHALIVGKMDILLMYAIESMDSPRIQVFQYKEHCKHHSDSRWQSHR